MKSATGSGVKYKPCFLRSSSDLKETHHSPTRSAYAAGRSPDCGAGTELQGFPPDLADFFSFAMSATAAVANNPLPQRLRQRPSEAIVTETAIRIPQTQISAGGCGPPRCTARNIEAGGLIEALDEGVAGGVFALPVSGACAGCIQDRLALSCSGRYAQGRRLRSASQNASICGAFFRVSSMASSPCSSIWR